MSKRHLGAAAAVLILGLGAGGKALAFPFQWGPVEGSFDTTLSLGASMRTEDRDGSLTGIANGGTSRSVNDDDGNLNYEKGDLISAAVKATHDLEFKFGANYGLFSRVSYFYDVENTDSRFLGPRGEDRLGSDFKLLDLFLYANVGPLSLRAGNQVVNWGESTFIGNGINVINSIDVAKIRTPGSEIKEALKPAPMLWLSFPVAGALSMEAFWLAEFDELEIDPRGSFFSSNDFGSDDGDRAYVGFGRRNDQHQPFVVPASPPAPSVGAALTAQAWLERDPTPKVRDEERQYGVALRYFAEALKSTEFGLYYINYHNRTPLASAIRGGSTNIASTSPRCSQSAVAGCRGTYFTLYPENVRLYGLSFNTDGPAGIALQGEYSYRPNQPVQLGAVEVLLASLGLANNITGGAAAAAGVPVGTGITGFRRAQMHQVQTTLTKAFGPTGDAEQFLMIAELGYNYVNLPSNLLFNGPGTSLPAPGSADVANGSFQSDTRLTSGTPLGYATRSSWGYRLVSRLDYEGAIGAAQLSPRVVFAHDVDGVGPNFNQSSKAVSLGLALNYLQRWQADLSYTAFFEGRIYAGVDPRAPGTGATSPGNSSQSAAYATSANPNRDRDFLGLSVSYAF